MDDRKQIEERLAKARAERIAAEAAHAEARELEALTAEAERAERAAVDAVAIGALEAQYGARGRKIAIVETDLGAIVVKRAHPNVFRKFQDGPMKSEQIDALVRACIVHPTGGRADAILEELPATSLRLAGAIMQLAGARSEELSGKS